MKSHIQFIRFSPGEDKDLYEKAIVASLKSLLLANETFVVNEGIEVQDMETLVKRAINIAKTLIIEKRRDAHDREQQERDAEEIPI